MCGIFAALLKTFEGRSNVTTYQTLVQQWASMSHRGPDRSRIEYITPQVLFGFHRLCINGLDKESDQPLTLGSTVLMCNGEIYNYKDLCQKYGITCKSNSDCEVILHLYKKFGIDKTAQLLDGVFAFIIFDEGQLHVCRDFLGIRPLFVSTKGSRDSKDVRLAFSSEAKGLRTMREVTQFTPGTWATYNVDNGSISNSGILHSFLRVMDIRDVEYPDNLHQKLRSYLHDAVRKRLVTTDRPIACLLSGGLDSTLVCAILVKELHKLGRPASSLHTYSIGLIGSVDLLWARKAAKFLGTTHHERVVSEKEFLSAIPRTVWHTETFDTTSIRASVGNLIVSEFVRDTSDQAVLFVGDVSDELFASYRGFCKAPSDEELFEANQSMLFDIHHYDVLRSDRSIAGAGLEARVPYGDLQFMNFVMKLHPSLKRFDSDGLMEKKILRDAFVGYLPDDLLYRRKEAFSDGVSSKERSWFDIIKGYVSTIFTPKDLETTNRGRAQLPIPDLETLWYFELYMNRFGKCMPNPIPGGFWRHPFCDPKADPSARLLDCY